MAAKTLISVASRGQNIPVVAVAPGLIKTLQLDPSPKLDIAPADCCIYCGSTSDLSDEHIIPYALNGEHVIRRASCLACARETGKFEQQVLRGPMRAARIHRRLRSRTKHSQAAQTQRLTLVKDSGEFEVDLPLSEYPILLYFPIFSPPGYLTGWKGAGIRMSGINVISFGPKPDEVAKAHGAREVRHPTTNELPTSFARMLAKIAYGYAYATGLLSSIDGLSLVLPSIRGLADDVGQWVFTATGGTVTCPGLLNRVDIHEREGMLVAEVQLFADSQTPTYGVILGRLKHAARN